MNKPAQLHAVRHPGPVTAGGALAWFAARQPVPGEETGTIGYLLAARRAEWFRWQEGAAWGPGGARDLAGAFEVHAISATCQLRWFHHDGGQGWAVCLAESFTEVPAGLPAGEPAPAGPPRRRIGTVSRMLAGRVSAAGDGWSTLTTARYSPCDVPVTGRAGQRVWAELAEYAVSDEHGNLSVVDTLLLSLAARDFEPDREEARR